MFVSPPEMSTVAPIQGRKGTLHAGVGEKLQISWWQGEKSGRERLQWRVWDRSVQESSRTMRQDTDGVRDLRELQLNKSSEPFLSKLFNSSS